MNADGPPIPTHKQVCYNAFALVKAKIASIIHVCPLQRKVKRVMESKSYTDLYNGAFFTFPTVGKNLSTQQMCRDLVQLNGN